MDGYLQEKQQITAMLNQDNKKYYFLILVVLFLFGCDNNKKELGKKTQLYMQHSKSIISEVQYKNIYQRAVDSLNLRADRKLQGFLQLTPKTWRLDSLICFNKEKNKCVSSILVQDGTTVSNAIDFFMAYK